MLSRLEWLFPVEHRRFVAMVDVEPLSFCWVKQHIVDDCLLASPNVALLDLLDILHDDGPEIVGSVSVFLPVLAVD